MKKRLRVPRYVGFYERKLIMEYNKIKDKTRKKEIFRELTLLDTFDTEIGFWISDLTPERTGLKFKIFIDELGIDRENEYYIPRLLVRDPDDDKNWVSVALNKENPYINAGKFKNNQDLTDVYNFIKEYYEILMKIWRNESNTWDFYDNILSKK